MKKKRIKYSEIENELPETFCPVPFAGLILNPNGDIGACREKGNEHTLGNIRDSSIEEIWNGEKIRAWRNEFLTGNIKTCKEEIKHNSCHKLKNYQSLLDHIDVREVVSTPILRLTPDLNGKCNLRCPFCDIWDLPNGLYDNIENFWEHLSSHLLPHILQIDFLAGEPFIQKDFYKLINLSSKHNSNCLWEITTNAQWKLTDKIKSDLDKISIRTISVSLDSVDPNTYSIIRSPGSLEKTLNTINDLHNYNKTRITPFQLLINFSIQKENRYELLEMFNFCEKYDTNIFIQYVYFPSDLSPSTLEEEERIKLITYYFNNLTSKQLIHSRRLILALIDTFDESLQKKFIYTYKLQTNGMISAFLNLV
ncbi:radical SAM protein [Halobacteriovorax marinus]|uniref:radical SAM protein n=1 Tax=Halobacteriovorax marinus TaxID=97084 RepID=UPI003A9246A0